MTDVFVFGSNEAGRHGKGAALFAASRPDLTFNVTPVGCGLAGYSQPVIRALFEPLPPNCRYSPEWII